MSSSWVRFVALAVLAGAVIAFGSRGAAPKDPCESDVDDGSGSPPWSSASVTAGAEDRGGAGAPAARVHWSRGTVTAVLRLPENVQGHSLRAVLNGRPSALPLRSFRDGDGDGASPALGARLLWRDVEAGEHRLVAFWLTDEPRLQVIDRSVTVAAGQQVELGVLEPFVSAPAQLRLQPVHLSGAWFTPEQLAASGLAEAQGRSWIADLSPIQLPLGRSVPVDGLSAEPLLLRASYGAAIRLDGAELMPQARANTGALRAGVPTEVLLPFARAWRLGLSLRWPGGHGWAEVHAVTAPDTSEWRRVEGVGAAALEFEVPTGPLLLVASRLDRGGATVAFALRSVAVDGPTELDVVLEPTEPVRGRWPDGDTRLEFALRAWPQHPLWRADTDAGGAFAVAGLPADLDLVLLREGAAPQPVRLDRVDGGLRAVFDPR